MTPAACATPSAARLPVPLRRQQLLHLSAAGWTRLLDAPRDQDSRACLELWAARGLPLVVTRQPPSDDDRVATGLPAPARHRRRRLPLAVAPADVMSVEEFPEAEAATPLLPRRLAPAWRTLLASLGAAGCAPRVYGGHGWQALTRLAYLHPGSDLDLLLPVACAAQADAVVEALAAPAWDGPRLDGELLFADGAAVAWREWLAWREGRVPQVLVKRLHGVALESPGLEPA